MNNVLIDTDVLIDFLVNREPYADDAEEIFLAATKKKIRIFTTGVILSNTYYILRKVFPHSKIITTFEKLTKYMQTINLDQEVVKSAIESKFLDFEDALQNYAAERSPEIDMIVTRNIKDYKHSQLSVMTPEEFIKTL